MSNKEFFWSLAFVILLLLVGLVFSVIYPNSKNQKFDGSPIQSFNHDGHKFITSNKGGIIHHPDCPCHQKP